MKTDTCWLWSGAHFSGSGYAMLSVERRPKGAHRVAYELLVGPIPDGAQIDHLCRVRGCVNPKHLEAVTCQTNLLRGVTKARANSEKTHCPHEHAYTPENTYLISGRRVCRACNLAQSAARYERLHGRTDKTIYRCGHARTAENTYVRAGQPCCRECTLRRNKESAERRKARRST